MILLGSLVNGAAVVAGTLAGMVAGKFLNKRTKETLTSAMALISIGIAISGMHGSTNALIPIISLAIGAIIGEALDIDRRVNALGDLLESKLKNCGSVTEGFVTGSVVLAVGAMGMMGALDSGLKNDHTILYAKSLIDVIYAMAFASTMGIGVAFSGLSVFAVEASVAVLASLIAPLLSSYVIAEITYVGSLILLAIGLNMLGITRLRILNLIPAVFFPVLLCQFIK